MSEAKHNFKARIMENIRIVTNHPNLKKDKQYFYVLCKGMNSGKPSETYIQNSFVVFVTDDETRERLYWLTYSLWRSKTFIPFLIGSVVPFIRLGDYKNVIKEKYDQLKDDVQNFDRTVNKLQLIERKEKQFKENIKLIQDLKRAYIHNYFHR